MSILKTEDLPKLRYSGRILASCLDLVTKTAKPGISAGKLDKMAIEFIRDFGAEPSFLGLYGYPYALISEVNEEVVHGMSPDSKIIPDNCIVSFDCGVNYQGIFTDMCILLTLGQVSQQVQILKEKTKEAMWAGINQVKAGKRVGDIGYAVDKIVKEAKLGNVLDLGGHGLGYLPHDEPHITHAGKPKTGSRLFENQVIAIEPMVTLGSGKVDFIKPPESQLEVVVSRERVASAHIEHTILVTKKGREVITGIDQDQLLS